jgi:hypothetical protein
MFHEHVLRKYLFKSKVIRLHFYTANVEYWFISNTFRNIKDSTLEILKAEYLG